MPTQLINISSEEKNASEILDSFELHKPYVEWNFGSNSDICGDCLKLPNDGLFDTSRKSSIWYPGANAKCFPSEGEQLWSVEADSKSDCKEALYADLCENLASQVIHEQIDWNISETCNMVETIPSFSDEKLSKSLNNKEYTEINDDISWYSEHQPVEEGSDDSYDSRSDYELHELPEVSNDDTVRL